MDSDSHRLQLEHKRMQQHKTNTVSGMRLCSTESCKAQRKKNLFASVLDYKALLVSRSLSRTIQSAM